MSAHENGGPAFPVDTRGASSTEDSGTFGHQTSPITWQFPGMTLRDYFAAKAMQGLLSCPVQPQSGPEMYARDAYAVADAMLKERAK